MKLKFNKWLFALVALIFGFSGTVAAQYGVVENHYQVKGNVISEKCKDAVPGIKITLRATDADGVDNDVVTTTDEKGNFSLELSDNEIYKFENFLLISEDTDGKDNIGDFQATRQQIVLRREDFTKTNYANWDQYFDSKTTYYFGLKFKNDEPCK